jgi:hypothetical protein
VSIQYIKNLIVVAACGLLYTVSVKTITDQFYMQFIYRDHALRENMLCNRLVQDCLLESDRDSF